MANIQKKILKELQIDLTGKFDKNFSHGGFFGNRWNGDIVACKIIHEPQFIQWGRPHVLVTRNQGLLCKRLYSSLSGSEEHIQVYSEDTKYEPFDIPREEIYGYALVIGVIHHE